MIQGILKSETTIGDRVVILGCGGVGLTFVQLCEVAGATKIIVADPSMPPWKARRPRVQHARLMSSGRRLQTSCARRRGLWR